MNNALARCPHCRKVSSVGPEFARGRGILFLALGILFFIIGIAVTMGTYRYARVSFSFNKDDGNHSLIPFGADNVLISSLYKIIFILSQDHGGVYVAYIGAFIIALFLFARTLYYCTLNVSTIDGPM